MPVELQETVAFVEPPQGKKSKWFKFDIVEQVKRQKD